MNEPISRQHLVCRSPAMNEVLTAIGECAEGNAPILIEGEPGTGREMVAQIIHFESLRRLGEFVVLEGEALSSTEAFSPPKAYAAQSVLQRAQGGTLLIKDLCALPRSSQHLIESVFSPGSHGDRRDSPRDVRVIGATDLDLRRVVDEALFPESFYQKFACRIVVPPLRERTLDIVPLVDKLVREYCKVIGRQRVRISTRAFDRFISYSWPGNVAELRVICRRLVFLAGNDRIEAEHVDSVLPRVTQRAPLEDVSFEEMVTAKLAEFLRQTEGYPLNDFYEEILARVERPLFSLILERTGQNQVKAAEILGVSRNTLRRKLVERGLKDKLARPTSASRRRNTRSSV